MTYEPVGVVRSPFETPDDVPRVTARGPAMPGP